MKKFKLEYIIIILVIILALIIFEYIKKINGVTSNETVNISEGNIDETNGQNIEALIQTITNTISTSSQISSGLTEQIQLRAGYYFEEIYFEENDYVAEGENIIKYSNGTYMTAPYNLVITSLNLPQKEEQCTNKNYIEVSSTDTLTLTCKIDEQDFNKISVGQETEIIVNVLEDKKYTGYVTNIKQMADYSSNGSTFTATITFENDGNIKIGMSASCKIILEKVEDAVTVPIEAVNNSGDNKYLIIVLEDGTTQQVTVETGISNEAYIEITTGITGTETVKITESTSNTRKSTTQTQVEGENFSKFKQYTQK